MATSRQSGKGVRCRWMLGAVVIACLGAGRADAQQPPSAGASTGKPASATAKAGTAPKAAAHAGKARLAEAQKKLAASDGDTVRAGIDALRELGGAQASKVLAARVKQGLPPGLIGPALDALVTLRAKSALPVIVELSQHRRGLLRGYALEAIGKLETRRGGAMQALMVASLEDPADEARRAAAEALARVGTQAALPALFAAYDRGVSHAIVAIAELAGRESLESVLARVQNGVFEPVEPVLDRMLERKKLPASAQRMLVRKLAESATPSARRYLLKWLDRIKLEGHAQVKEELFEAIKSLDAAQSAPAPAALPAATPAPASVRATGPSVVASKAGAR